MINQKSLKNLWFNNITVRYLAITSLILININLIAGIVLIKYNWKWQIQKLDEKAKNELQLLIAIAGEDIVKPDSSTLDILMKKITIFDQDIIYTAFVNKEGNLLKGNINLENIEVTRFIEKNNLINNSNIKIINYLKTKYNIHEIRDYIINNGEYLSLIHI